jgi:hypothetical protein
MATSTFRAGSPRRRVRSSARSKMTLPIRIVGGRIVLGTPKSHLSRTVPVPRFLARQLAAAVAGKSADDLVFTMPGGSLLRLSNWRRSVYLPARSRRELGTPAGLTIRSFTPRTSSDVKQARWPYLRSCLPSCFLTVTGPLLRRASRTRIA